MPIVWLSFTNSATLIGKQRHFPLFLCFISLRFRGKHHKAIRQQVNVWPSRLLQFRRTPQLANAIIVRHSCEWRASKSFSYSAIAIKRSPPSWRKKTWTALFTFAKILVTLTHWKFRSVRNSKIRKCWNLLFSLTLFDTFSRFQPCKILNFSGFFTQ